MALQQTSDIVNQRRQIMQPFFGGISATYEEQLTDRCLPQFGGGAA